MTGKQKLTVHEQTPGVCRVTLEMASEHRDGELLLRVEWSADDACWYARYHHESRVSNALGTGDTKEAALADLCGALLSEIDAWRSMYYEKGGAT